MSARLSPERLRQRVPCRWRVLFTDTESESGVGLVCESKEHPFAFPTAVYDCCPSLQFETWSEDVAKYLVEVLNNDTDEAAILWLSGQRDCNKALAHCHHYGEGNETCCYCERRSPREQVKDSAGFYPKMSAMLGQERLPGGES